MEELLTRGVASIVPGKKELAKALQEKKLNIYLGIDPTASRIHLGHAVSLRKLQEFVNLGHQVTFLIGDFTSLVGDTSDKESERPILTSEEINANFQTYKQQAEKLLDFNKVIVRQNSEWLAKLTFADIIKLTQNFSLNDFISRELIRKRLDEGKRIRLDEVMYPLMQGFDSYSMNTDLQIGGADQIFNMQTGRALQKNLRDKESYVLTTEFLLGTDGRKMSKSWGNAIWLDENADEMYGKVMSLHDDLIVSYFTLGTNIRMERVQDIEKKLKSGENPMKIKKELAFEIVKELHSEKDAEKAQEQFEQVFQKKDISIAVQALVLSANLTQPILNVVMQTKVPESKSDARRLIEQGAVEYDNKKCTDPTERITFEKGKILKIGKRHFFEVQ